MGPKEKVYVYCDFIKPGKQHFTVFKNQELHVHKAILMNREEDIFPFNKLLKFKKKQFRKEDSLFADVKSKNDSCYSYDKDLWRLDEKLIRSAAHR